MPLTALPVTATDIATLEQGVQFFQSSAANQTSVAASINAPGSTTSVFTYAASLLGLTAPSLAQVAMADTAILEGGTIAVGNATTTNTLTFLATSFLPAQFATGATLAPLGVNPTLFASEGLGLALASTAGFKAQYGSLTQSQFISTLSTQTGVGANFIGTFVQNWLTFYNGVGAAAVPPGLTALQAAEGAAAGDTIGAALFATTAPGPLPLTTVFSTQSPQTPTQFSPNTVKGLVANALIDNAEGTYVTGVALTALPQHTPLQGEFTTAPVSSVFLTTGIDNATQGFSSSSTGTPLLNGFTATASGTSFSATFGGAGATWTPGDQVTATAGTTGQSFTITGNGPAGNINVTNLPTNKVSNIQTVTVNANTVLGALNTESVTGDFSTTGPMGAWTGLVTLMVNSGSGAIQGADNLTAATTTAITVNDTNTGTAAGSTMTVSGGSTVTITENNLGANGGGIAVNGGNGTSSVTITQTEPAGVVGSDGAVKIVDFNSVATPATAGTITTVTLDGLSHPLATGNVFNFGNASGLVRGTTLNSITDNALATLTIKNSDVGGAAISIIDSLTPATATTLALNLTHDGVGANGFAPASISALTLIDTNNEITTLNLTLTGNSFLNFADNGLTKLTTGALDSQTGGLVAGVAGSLVAGVGSTISDTVNAGVNLDFSGLNASNFISVFRGTLANADTYTLSDFGTNNAPGLTTTTFQTAQHLQIFDGSVFSTNTVNFGSGADLIGVNPHFSTAANHDSFVLTAQNGPGIANFGGPGTPQQWSIISDNTFVGSPGIMPNDTLTFAKGAVSGFMATAPATVLAGIQGAIGTPAGTVTEFFVGGNSYYYDHVATGLSTTGDALVEAIGIHPIASFIAATHTIVF